MTKKILIIAVIVTVCCTACRLVGVTVTYNMTGGSLDPAIKTFSVDYFPNKAPLVMPTLSTTFTEKLTEYIRQKTGLTQLTDNNGDIRFEGQIVEYSQRPMDITSGEIATSNRLTIGIRVKYTNMLSFNTRVIALFISLFIDMPWLYFTFEIIVLNAMLVYMIKRHEHICQGFTQELKERCQTNS